MSGVLKLLACGLHVNHDIYNDVQLGLTVQYTYGAFSEVNRHPEFE